MCGRFALAVAPGQLADLYSVGEREQPIPARHNITPRARLSGVAPSSPSQVVKSSGLVAEPADPKLFRRERA